MTTPSTGPRILKANTTQVPGHRPLLCDILLEEEVPIRLRDGIVIYADVYRPSSETAEGCESVPAIIAAGPFGKNGGPNKANFNKWPWRFGCPKLATSGLEKFEGPDPAYWCLHGYAIVHTDCRGTWTSEGDVSLPCKREGEDNYDIIETIAKLPWCNGKVTMAGNSYLAMTQWFAGAENPPHLACLAPWEGVSDLYRDILRRGGVPNPGFTAGLLKGDLGSARGSKTIDIHGMTYKYPVWNEFWESHRANLQAIRCPMYIVSSWTNALHVQGTFRAWEESGSIEKWLRVHNTHEWPDLYDSVYVEDLRKFYEYYMKDINNDWPMTPRVRLSVLNPGGRDIINRPKRSFPLQRQLAFKLFLDPGKSTLSDTPIAHPGIFSYDAKAGDVKFTWEVPRRMEFTGYMKLRLWAEAVDSSDMDVFVCVTKQHSATGATLESVLVDVGRQSANPIRERETLHRKHTADSTFGTAFFAAGPSGCLRASHRALDESQSTPFHAVHLHREEHLLRRGQIVPLDISIWPYGIIFEEGDVLCVTISGYHPNEHCRPTDPRPELRNQGTHKFYSGGDEYDSFLLLPFIPEEDFHSALRR
ncbi:hydrolase CocE/NonD family protein [Aspergillus pseudoustus]|uniref:Hydrolase CocE/NonD family protein n=1 Tax=Aspergillus pseudoustus TaxID=1810923 RepID=A0ABR4JID6_9EURO